MQMHICCRRWDATVLEIKTGPDRRVKQYQIEHEQVIYALKVLCGGKPLPEKFHQLSRLSRP